MNWHTTEPCIPLGRPAWEPYSRRDAQWASLSPLVSQAIGRLNRTGYDLRIEVSNRLAAVEQNVSRRAVDIDNQRVAMVKAADAYAIARAHSEQIAQLQADLKRLSRKAVKRPKGTTQ